MALSGRLNMALLAVVLLFSIEKGNACSMYKVTVNGKTMVGCNEDAWRTTPRIWFEVAAKAGEYGAAFTGSRFDGSNGFAPQSGMNVHGLVFSRLASADPGRPNNLSVSGKPVTNPTQYLKDIIHKCRTVEEVKQFIGEYDHSFFTEDVFIYIDSTGKYLVVEPYTITVGNDAAYVLSNFCPSATAPSDALRLDRYRKGVDFLKSGMDTSIGFCTALSDSMHVCRAKIGDGTLLTSIWDSKEGRVCLYFYHNYGHPVFFNIKEELAKGDHMLEIPALFPPNAEFDKLARYKIPQNNIAIMLFLMCCGMLFLFSAFYFLISFFKGRKTKHYSVLKLALVPLSLMMFYYMYVLVRTIGIFYFPAPYTDPHSILISIASYFPYLVLVMIVPLCVLNVIIIRKRLWGRFPIILLTANSIVYLILIGLFIYWKLY